MPRGDGTGPMGNGPIGRGRNSGQGMGSGRQSGMMNTNSTNQGSLEDQAARLEEQAANLRKRATQNSKTE